MKKLVTGLMLLCLAGSSNAGIFDVKPKVTKSDFDGKTSIMIQPMGLTCRSKPLVCPMVGYGWFDDIPNQVALAVEINDMARHEFYPIKALKLNIDGTIIELPFLGDGTTNYKNEGIALTTSYNVFKLPLEVAQKINIAKSVKVQILTDNGTFEDTLKGWEKQTRAEKTLQSFLDEVNKIRK